MCKQLKKYPLKVLLLSTPREGDELYIYLMISQWDTSAVIVREEKRVQHLMYYTSKILFDANIRYLKIEKWAFALVTVHCRLRQYFQSYPVIMMMNQPLRQVLHKPYTSIHLVK